MDELISVIINVYNGEEYIEKCIQSIIDQTYKNLEILIINDGSTDNTLNICQNFKDNRIRIINQPNMGLSKSRNVGIENAKGEYLYFIDADDYVENDVIEYLYSLAIKHNAPLSTCKPLNIYNYNFTLKNKSEKIQILSSKEMLKEILLSKDNAGTIWNKLIKKDLFNNIKFEDRIANDVVVTHKIIIEAKKVVYSNQIKYYYLKHEESILGQKKLDHEIDCYRATIERYEYIKNIYPKLIENKISINHIILVLYLNQNKEVLSFLEKQNAYKLYKSMFSFKVIFLKMKFREKMKLILFEINPKLCLKMVNYYLDIIKKSR